MLTWKDVQVVEEHRMRLMKQAEAHRRPVPSPDGLGRMASAYGWLVGRMGNGLIGLGLRLQAHSKGMAEGLRRAQSGAAVTIVKSADQKC